MLDSIPVLLNKQGIAALCFVMMIPSFAFAKDLELLAKILSGPFLGQQGVAICSTGDVPFSPEELSTIVALNAHANYMKPRIPEALLTVEKTVVLREAAD